MNTIEVLEEACAALKVLGYQVRTEPLDGGGGSCEFGGRKWLFLDASSTPAEHLRTVLDVLRGEFYIARIQMTPTLQRLVYSGAAAA